MFLPLVRGSEHDSSTDINKLFPPLVGNNNQDEQIRYEPSDDDDFPTIKDAFAQPSGFVSVNPGKNGVALTGDALKFRKRKRKAKTEPMTKSTLAAPKPAPILAGKSTAATELEPVRAKAVRSTKDNESDIVNELS